MTGQVRGTSDIDFFEVLNDFTLQDSDEIIPSIYDLKSNCEYYSPRQVTDITKQSSNRQLSMFCINCQSLNSHLASFKLLMSNMSNDVFSFDLVGVTEVFQIHEGIDYGMGGYFPLLYKTRLREGRENRGGGVGLYMKDHLSYTQREDLSVFINKTFESLFVELCFSNKQRVVIGMIYKPPSANMDIF